mmetsp:Transcript_25339/g.48518  ORF Transcript_25339/g.48518 Transcript_25339/m.48518 type:complete len:87 (-) Transcript_25339:222-482(-)
MSIVLERCVCESMVADILKNQCLSLSFGNPLTLPLLPSWSFCDDVIFMMAPFLPITSSSAISAYTLVAGTIIHRAVAWNAKVKVMP